MRAFDVISDYIQQLNDGARELEEADTGLLAELDALWKGQAAAEPAAEAEVSGASEAETGMKLELPEGVDPDGDISDDEFEALLNQRDALMGGEMETADAPEPKLELPEGSTRMETSPMKNLKPC